MTGTSTKSSEADASMGTFVSVSSKRSFTDIPLSGVGRVANSALTPVGR